MSALRILRVAGSLTGIAGMLVIAWAGGWLLAAGVFLVVFGNNLERSERLI